MSELTREHSCMIVHGLSGSSELDLEWLGEFTKGECFSSIKVNAHTNLTVQTSEDDLSTFDQA